MLYKETFKFLEENTLLDSLNEVHLFCLHFVYLPRINASLEEFRNQWNYHGIRTCNHQTPREMWQSNMITVLDESPLININSYGIDYNMVCHLKSSLTITSLCQVRKWNLLMNSSRFCIIMSIRLLTMEIMALNIF